MRRWQPRTGRDDGKDAGGQRNGIHGRQQRIGVRIAIDPGQPLSERLRPGMSVQARVDTRGRP